MYAVIRTGGKQYRVAKDDVITIERLDGQAGDKVKFDDVLMLGETGKEPKIGAPTLAGASVTAEVLEQGRGDKISVIKFRRRKNYHRNKGHRQHETMLKITDISALAPKKAPAKASAQKATPEATPEAKKEAKKTTPEAKKEAKKATPEAKKEAKKATPKAKKEAKEATPKAKKEAKKAASKE